MLLEENQQLMASIYSLFFNSAKSYIFWKFYDYLKEMFNSFVVESKLSHPKYT